jgi:ATP-dependent protease ClpP protease subunit
MDILLSRITALSTQYQALTAHRTAPPGIETDKWYNIVAPVNETDDTTSIMLYGAIGGWFGLEAREFVKELNDIKTAKIDVHINSPGGSIFDGAAIYTALKSHSAEITAYVDGIAASAASFIAMAADKIIISSAGTMMIHDGAGLTWGNEADHLVTAKLLGKLSNTIANLYARRAGGTAQEWRDAMLMDNGAGTWYNAKEAVEAGLADETDDDEEEEETTSNRNPIAPVAVLPDPIATQPVETDPWDITPEDFRQMMKGISA